MSKKPVPAGGGTSLWSQRGTYIGIPPTARDGRPVDIDVTEIRLRRTRRTHRRRRPQPVAAPAGTDLDAASSPHFRHEKPPPKKGFMVVATP
jgi:hypothetical protein